MRKNKKTEKKRKNTVPFDFFIIVLFIEALIRFHTRINKISIAEERLSLIKNKQKRNKNKIFFSLKDKKKKTDHFKKICVCSLQTKTIRTKILKHKTKTDYPRL